MFMFSPLMRCLPAIALSMLLLSKSNGLFAENASISGALSLQQLSYGNTASPLWIGSQLQMEKSLGGLLPFHDSSSFDGRGVLKLNHRMSGAGTVDLAEVREAGVAAKVFEDWHVFLGSKIVSWGKSDEVNPLDVVNGEHFQRFVLDNKAARRRSREMLVIDWQKSNQRWELIAMPQRVAHTFDFSNSQWCQGDCRAFDPRLLSTRLADQGIIMNKEDATDQRKAELALRYSQTIQSQSAGAIDVSLVAHRGNHRVPVYLRTPVADAPQVFNVRQIFPTRDALGADAAFVVGAYSVRLEGIFHKDRAINYRPDALSYWQDDDGVTNVDETETVVGIDRQTEGGLYANLQYAQRKLSRSGSFVELSGKRLLSLQLRGTFWADRLTLGLLNTSSLEASSLLTKPEINYWIDDQSELALVGHIFAGGRESLFGTFKDQSGWLVQWSHFF